MKWAYKLWTRWLATVLGMKVVRFLNINCLRGSRRIGGPRYCSSIGYALGKDEVSNFDEFKK